jgi:sigma-B regulation protein RsbU (phosphoserine phosphatase)
MGATNPAAILLCGDPPDGQEVCEVGELLQKAGYAVCRKSCQSIDAQDLDRCRLILIDSGRTSNEGLACCRRLHARQGENLPPLLVIIDESAPATRLACLEAGADAYLLRPFAAGELLAQVQALLRAGQTQRRLADQSAEMHTVHQRLKQAYHQIDLEMEAARRLQMGFLPRALPDVPGAHFAVHYRPCGRVGGDFYDVFRLDENHVGLYVADAMGHGVPASLLTIFLKRGVCGKVITGQQYRLLPPSEVLGRLNRDLVELALPEVPFITMLYVLLNFRDGTLRFARAGHPHPLHVPRAGDLTLWPGEGGLLGVFVANFREQAHRLELGDKLLLYTDGLGGDPTENGGRVNEHLHSCADRFRSLPIEEYVPRLAHELLSQVEKTDDFTLLGVERTAAGEPAA